MTEHYYALIMAGGGGTRLWPLSRAETPKQLLPLVEDHSMFREAVTRLAPLFTPDRIYVVTGRRYVDAMRADTPEIPAENFIAEPYGKESGPAAGLGMAVIYKRDPQATVVILTADHHIAQRQRFRDVLAAAYAAAQERYIVTLGITPSAPATGFGYIQRGDELQTIDGFAIYHSAGFREKPDAETAVRFVTSGIYSWNSGMFIWRADLALREFERQQPDFHALLMELLPSIDTPQYAAALDHVWERVKKISLDYAVMEHAERMAVIPVDIGWSDVGSWDALYDVLPQNADGNIFKNAATDHITIDTRGTLVYSDKLTVMVGVQDLVIVETPDALMILHKDRAQDVKTIVNQLRSHKLDRYL